jgi:hypothetical protein
MTTLPGMVTIELEGQLPGERFRAIWGLCIDFEVQLVFKGGEKVLNHRVIPAAALG